MTAAEDTQAKAKLWKDQIELAEKDSKRSAWIKRGEKIVKRYRDERDAAQENQRRMNVLWSNVQTLQPSLYGREPVPIAERRFLDRDPVGRVAAIILERTMRYNMGDSQFHGSMRKAILDYLLPGRGTLWVRYEPTIGTVETAVASDDEGDAGDAEAGDGSDGQAEPLDTQVSDTPPDQASERLLSEQTCVDYVDWKDFFTFPAKARTWNEVEAVGRRVFMSRDELNDRFGKLGRKVPLDHKVEGADNLAEDLAKATVTEIWHKPTSKVLFVAKEFEGLLEEKDDPLHLEGFWPCPTPLFATMTNDTMIPVPDFVEYQDQALELDALSQRIARLTSALKVAGVYDGSAPGLQRLLNEDLENELIPVNSWAAFAEKGGLQGAIAFLPIKEIAEVLAGLYQARAQQKQDLYEITGISDVLRGQSDPNETARAQTIKGRFASMRLQDRQQEVSRFCRDTIRIMGEIISEHYSPQTLITCSGIMNDDTILPSLPSPPVAPQLPQLPPNLPPEQMVQAQQQLAAAQQQAAQAQQQYQQQVQQIQMQRQKLVQDALALLKQDKLRGFRIDIETDTTMAEDALETKQSRVELVTAVSSFLTPALAAGEKNPDLIPLLTKTLLFVIRGFRVGRDLESAFEEFSDKSDKMVKQNAGKPPSNPEMIKAQAEVEKAKIEAQSEQSNAAMTLQHKQTEQQVAAMKVQSDQQLSQFEAETKRQLMEMQHGLELTKAQQQQQFEAMRHDFKMKEMYAAANEAKTPAQVASERQMADEKDAAASQREQLRDAHLAAFADHLGALHGAVAQHSQHTQATHQALESLRQHIAAPTEIVRDQHGRAVGARKMLARQ